MDNQMNGNISVTVANRILACVCVYFLDNFIVQSFVGDNEDC